MYIYEKRALKRCHHVMLRDLNPNVTLLTQLEYGQVINQCQKGQVLVSVSIYGNIKVLEYCCLFINVC
jgi:hypothetical protein